MIPGILISLATFPGVIVHEAAHQFFCKLCRVAVLDVCYFRAGNPAGYVLHETPSKPSQHVLIGIGPMIVNTLVGALISLPAAIPVFQFESASPLHYFLIWLGVSIAMHSFPSTGDAKNMWQAAWSKGGTSPFLKLIASPLVVVIYICSIGSVFWLDLFYGVGVAMLIPNLLVRALA